MFTQQWMFVRTDEQEQKVKLIGDLADSFIEEAHLADLENRFSYNHIEALRGIGYPAFTVPKAFGGQEISIYELVLYQERLAQGDAAIALGIGWHLSVMYDLNHRQLWSTEQIEKINKAVVTQKMIVNRAATEKSTGSPQRGGKPQTTAIALSNGTFLLNGRKTFTSLSPVLDYYIVTAGYEERTVEFIIPRDTKGITIDPTWDVVGMKGTASHDLVLDNVIVPTKALVYNYPSERISAASPALLHIPACYLGIALAARREALRFAKEYQPSTLTQPILYTPSVTQQLGQMELELHAARHFLYSVAQRWDTRDTTQDDSYLIPELTAAKVFAQKAAMSVVDIAMKIVGAHSLAVSHPLQRLYRDVRFGLHNPPMEDMVITNLGKQAIHEATLLI
ncbi:acyl-CoA dehydrogenase family protein [Paenibacillus endoradicis]|uniref:acyl-CoA dehydrogenase family protein n=1 Tax=Paenibacillus endoradicis TaxID=2972487 RepID=UPI0021596915|nr:acyl-CoA dehydrogenase family protein [Paenibacillus endoradicis]MCR8660194.1 acyl-CoA/acyl-ACP dehydrogenase [Paenibacillus endoradicis]